MGGKESEYRLILNKFPCLPHHILLISTDYVQQTDALNEKDFEIAWDVFASLLLDGNNAKNPLLFFNSGIHSGATQMHRHLHFIPNTTGDTLLLNEIAQNIKLKAKNEEKADDDDDDVNVQTFEGFPFLHGLVLLDEHSIDGDGLHKCYQELMKMIKDKMS